MRKVLSNGLLPVLGVEAVDVLPCVARLAVYCVSVIVGEVAYALDGIRLFLWHLDLVSDMIGNGWAPGREVVGLTGDCGLRRQRSWLVCHSPREDHAG